MDAGLGTDKSNPLSPSMSPAKVSSKPVMATNALCIQEWSYWPKTQQGQDMLPV